MGQTVQMNPKEPEITSRFALASTCGLIMYACAAGYGGYFVLRDSSTPRVYLGVILGLPAVAMAFFLVASLLIPSLLAPRRMAFPLNFTLPPVFAAFTVLSVMLLTSTGNSLIVPYDRVRAAMFWASPFVLLLVTISQVLCLTLLTLLKSKPVD